jgi:hypothetical protein
MSSRTPAFQADPDGHDADTDNKPGLRVVRRADGQSLIQLACYAIWEASSVAVAINERAAAEINTGPVSAHAEILEALTCLKTAEVYLQLFEAVFDSGARASDHSGPPG